jgi:N-acetylglucosamine-1-phosphate uridyltransferase (contains nucleotidyltransferase and I-patch acetyltransferase domains)
MENHFIAADVDRARISPSAVIHPGCRISGAETSIGPDCELGAEGAVTLRNCQLGKGVTLGGGFAEGTTFLDGSSFGDSFHIRPGSLIEEEASGGHSVGLKQTVIFPFVTLGSLINFCDILMAGGTGAKNHSEVGSSYIHFNFTPHQDKATASLVGDVPRGVLLREEPIFLGGQGGLVGPARIAYGTVAAAGTLLRGDIVEERKLVMGGGGAGPLKTRDYDQTRYGDITRIVANCLAYIGNIAALRCWYERFRRPLMTRTTWGEACLEGALKRLEEIRIERVKRLDQLAEKVVKSSTPHASHEKFLADWDALRPRLETPAPQSRQPAPPPQIAAIIAKRFVAPADADANADCVKTIQTLSPEERQAVTEFLEGVASSAVAAMR